MLIARGDLSRPAMPWVNRLAESFDRSLPWVLAIWFTGTTLLLCRLNIGLIVARRMKSIATQPVAIELQSAFLDLSRRLGVIRPVSLMNSAIVQVPTVIGWLRPAVLLPLGCLTGLSAIQIEAIFAHELAHIRRHDYLVSVFQSIVYAVLFYHPAVWWVSRQVRREREDSCDDLAVKISGDPLAYAKALSFLEERRGSLPAVALGANGGVLAARIKRLLGCKQPPAYSSHGFSPKTLRAAHYKSRTGVADPQGMKRLVLDFWRAQIHGNLLNVQRLQQSQRLALYQGKALIVRWRPKLGRAPSPQRALAPDGLVSC
jgi:hypothetical protein